MFDRIFPSQDSDIQLIEKAKTNQHDFARLYDRYVDVVYRFVQWRISNKQDREDIVSQTFMTVVEKLPYYDTTRNQKFSTRVLGIANYKILDKLRDYYEPEITLNTQSHDLDDPDDNYPDIFANKQLYDQIIHFVQTLSDRQSSIFLLRFVEGQSNAEIASIYNISPKTVSSSIVLVLNKIREHLSKVDR